MRVLSDVHRQKRLVAPAEVADVDGEVQTGAFERLDDLAVNLRDGREGDKFTPIGKKVTDCVVNMRIVIINLKGFFPLFFSLLVFIFQEIVIRIIGNERTII